MKKQTVQKGIVLSLVMSAGVLLAGDNFTNGVPDPNMYEKTGRTKSFEHIDDDLSGMPEISDVVIEDIMEHYPEVAERVNLLKRKLMAKKFYPDGMILVGEPGVSKTTIALAVAQMLGRKVVFLEATSLVGDKYQNSGVNALEEKLNKVNKDSQGFWGTKYVVIIDEIMRLAEKFENEKGEGKDIATKLWLTLDKFKASKNVFFIATANDIDKLPKQVKSRFGNDIITIEAPNDAYRKKIIQNHLEGFHNLSHEELQQLVKKTSGMTHRDLASIVLFAGRAAIDRVGDDEKPSITLDDLLKSIGRLKDINKQGWVDWGYDIYEKNEKAIKLIGLFGSAVTVIALTGGAGATVYAKIMAGKVSAEALIAIKAVSAYIAADPVRNAAAGAALIALIQEQSEKVAQVA
jgi:AAA+ superfamily predicted ATPase